LDRADGGPARARNVQEPVMADIDLTSPGSTTTIDGVIVTYGDPIGSGTGIYSPFLAIDDNDGDEKGFNTDASGVLDSDASKTSSLTFNQIPVKVIDGAEYFEFRLDLNQTNANTLISLTSLKLYYSGAPATGADYIAATHELDSDFTKVFDLDGSDDTRLLLNAHSSGSGNDDYVFYVPVSSFAGADFSSDFITLYADFGSPGTAYAANDGFEEFNTEKVSIINGVKFNDTDGDGVKDAGEAGLAGWTIFIDSNANGVLDAGERSTVTDANGAFQFGGVGTSLESVRIDEVLQAGWVQTTGDYETVDVSSAGTYSVQIGNFLPNPALNVTKDASVPGGTANLAGEVVSYTISVANTGNVALTGVTVTDPFVSNLAPVLSSGFNSGDIDHDNILDTTETWHYTATHTVTQAEIDAGGTIDNIATADSDQTGPDTDPASVPVEQNPALNIVKDASVPGGTADTAGELISYTITVANTGNVTLDGVTVTDPFADVGSIVRGADVSGDNDALLEVGETWGYTAAHTVTQAEIDSNGGGDGLLQNIATADSNQTGPDTDDASIPVEQKAHIDIEKYVSIDGGATWDDADNPMGPIATSGASIAFKFVVTNTGNVTLTNTTVTDSVFDLNGAAAGTAAALGTLAVGASTEFQITAPWAVGQHVNDATATGSYSGGTASDHDLAYYYGLIDCVGTRTPGFWLSPNGLTFWDGTVGNETKSGPEFPTGELLAFNNGVNDGPDPGSSNKEERYILLGDDNGNGITDAGEDTLQMSLALALKVIDASMKPSQDARYVLGRDVVAAWLNFEAGNGAGSPLDPNSPAHKMDLAIDWLQQYADANHDGIADFNGPAIKQSSAAWQGSGAALHTALDEYNNNGTVNGVFYSCSADDHLFTTMLTRYHEDALA
jgi:uncharacterized repeat protein (TIGR01451 family)